MKPLFRSMIDKLRPGRTEDSLGKKPGTKDPLVDTGTDSNNSTIGLVIKKALAIGSLLVTPLLPACFIPADKPDNDPDEDLPTEQDDQESDNEYTLPDNTYLDINGIEDDPEPDDILECDQGYCTLGDLPSLDLDPPEEDEGCDDECSGACRRNVTHNDSTVTIDHPEESDHWDRVDIDALLHEEVEDQAIGPELARFLSELTLFSVTTRDEVIRSAPVTVVEAGPEMWMLPSDAVGYTLRTCCCGDAGIYFPEVVNLSDFTTLTHEALGHFMPNRWTEVVGELGSSEGAVAAFLRLAEGGASEADAIAFYHGIRSLRIFPGYAATGVCDRFREDIESTGETITADHIRHLLSIWESARYFNFVRLNANGWDIQSHWEDLQSLRGNPLMRRADEETIALIYGFMAMQDEGVDLEHAVDLIQLSGIVQEISRRGGPAARRLVEAALYSSVDRRRDDVVQGLGMICTRQARDIDHRDCPEDDPICRETGAERFGEINENLWCVVQEDPLSVALFNIQGVVYAESLYTHHTGGEIVFNGQRAEALVVYDPSTLVQLTDGMPLPVVDPVLR